MPAPDLAYDPASKDLVFTPDTKDLALNCPGCTECPADCDTCPSTLTAVVAGITGGLFCDGIDGTYVLTKTGCSWDYSAGYKTISLTCSVVGGVPVWLFTFDYLAYAGCSATVDMDADCLCPLAGTYVATGTLNCTGDSGTVAIS